MGMCRVMGGGMGMLVAGAQGGETWGRYVDI